MSLDEYFELPESVTSVLEAEEFQQVDENVFKCYAPAFEFFGYTLQPVVTAQVRA